MIEVFNYVQAWALKESKDMTSLDKLIKIVIVFIIVRIVIKISYILIDRFFKREQTLKLRMEERKANTLSAIIKSLSKYIFYFIGLLTTLEIFSIPTASILATAGVGGLAIGFGAQSLVKDIITGFFILFEDYFSVGDYIKTGEFDGIVEEIGIRSTRIRAFSGDLYIIPNGHIEIVTNRSRGDMRAWVDIRIDYTEDIDKAISALNRVSDKMSKDERINCGPKVVGVTNLTKEDVVLSIMAMTKPMEQWDVERALRKQVKEEFETSDIAISDSKKVVLESEK